MPERNEMALTSFAENPTKAVEKDALVETETPFTRPEQVEKANLKETKWPWSMGKKNEKMPRFFIILLLICLLVAVALIALIALLWTFNSSAATPVHESQMVYTLPSRATDEGNVGLAQVLISHADSKESLEEQELTTESVIEIKDSVVEKEVSAEELKKQDSEEFMSTRKSILNTDSSEEKTPEATTTTIASTTVRRTRPTTRTSTLQFYESVDGETTETCVERLAMGSPSGVYTLQGVKNFQVYCDMDTTSGGWTVIQRRVDGDGAFHRGTFKQYVEGFGALNASHWLGLEKIHSLAPHKKTSAILRIEIQGYICGDTCAKRFQNTWYGEWIVSFDGKQDGYKIYINGNGTGNLTFDGSDPMLQANGMRFATVDKSQEGGLMNCAHFRAVGAWWHRAECSDVGLNGYYQTIAQKYDAGDPNQNAKRYFVWAFDRKMYNGYPYIIHVRKSVMMIQKYQEDR
ncbi:hypothetical protein GCK72_025090 [Caenorhabditis remanei]|uniref:Fibrinogen C-terminal domain-containing protein n=1 Tax=Caenorhabditis remanei TaxID=31234 RepID=A0A6A5G1F3_CAERE|nr:hypothetical protein GCK72_025090 [Caenorhabditis remanei]KAF1748623.1 hypothetical protein GCK72_025090 [Caenorhabditis remanei]